MAHQRHLEKANYRQWTKAGLGLVYLKEGLAPFCQDVANQQHKDILDNIQRSKKLTGDMKCGTCHLRTLKPDHVKAGNKECPLKQTNCNCCFPEGTIVCQKNICGAVYDCIIQKHASTPPAPYWKNTDTQLWTSDPWSIAKCFINAPGYDQKTSAADTDCTGLLHMIINNKYFHNHLACNASGTSIFSKVRGHRNNIFHSDSQELEETTANSYIDDMIAVLKDGKELSNTSYAQEAVNKLKELKNKDFIISSENYEILIKQIREDFVNNLNELKLAKEEEYEGLKRKVSNIERNISEQERKRKITRVEDSPEQKQLEYENAGSVIDKTVGRLNNWMIPDLIIDADDENKLFEYRDRRDIKEQITTTEKNELILRKVRSEGKNGYIVFKELLKKTQEKLVVFLTCKENGQDTKEIEKDLNKMAEERLNLIPRYFEHRKVIDKTVGRLKDCMKPDLNIDADDENKLFGYRDKRDIKRRKIPRVEDSPEQKQLEYENARSVYDNWIPVYMSLTFD